MTIEFTQVTIDVGRSPNKNIFQDNAHLGAWLVGHGVDRAAPALRPPPSPLPSNHPHQKPNWPPTTRLAPTFLSPTFSVSWPTTPIKPFSHQSLPLLSVFNIVLMQRDFSASSHLCWASKSTNSVSNHWIPPATLTRRPKWVPAQFNWLLGLLTPLALSGIRNIRVIAGLWHYDNYCKINPLPVELSLLISHKPTWPMLSLSVKLRIEVQWNWNQKKKGIYEHWSRIDKIQADFACLLINIIMSSCWFAKYNLFCILKEIWNRQMLDKVKELCYKAQEDYPCWNVNAQKRRKTKRKNFRPPFQWQHMFLQRRKNCFSVSHVNKWDFAWPAENMQDVILNQDVRNAGFLRGVKIMRICCLFHVGRLHLLKGWSWDVAKKKMKKTTRVEPLDTYTYNRQQVPDLRF